MKKSVSAMPIIASANTLSTAQDTTHVKVEREVTIHDRDIPSETRYYVCQSRCGVRQLSPGNCPKCNKKLYPVN